MPVTLEWFDEEKTILLQKTEGYWLVEDLMDVITESSEMINARDQVVDVIMDLSDFSRPPILKLAKAARHTEQVMSAKRGAVCVVTTSPYFRALYRAVGRLAPSIVTNTYFVASIEEALETINRARGGRGADGRRA